MPVGEIIAIGTELLLGEIQDTNTVFINRKLRDHGIDIYRSTIVGDNPERISAIIREALIRADIVITTGGLGPTVDDPTRAAMALAFDDRLIFIPELWGQITERFERFGRAPSANNKRQAYIPSSAHYIENPVGTAPAFYIQRNGKFAVSLPGVPREMEYLLINSVFPLLHQKYQLDSLIKAKVIHTAGIGESTVDEIIGDLELNANPTVGLLANPGQTDIRVTAKASSQAEADVMIDDLVQTITERLGIAVFGFDNQTLPAVTASLIEKHPGKIILSASGFDRMLSTALGNTVPANLVMISPSQDAEKESFESEQRTVTTNNSDCYFSFSYNPTEVVQQLQVTINFTGKSEQTTFRYGGPAGLGSQWAVNTSLDMIRRRLIENHG